MDTDNPLLDPSQETDMTCARRKELFLANLKMFRVTLDAVRSHAEWVEARHGITAVDLWVLWELAQAPGLRLVDLAKRMALPRSTMEVLMSGLLQRGLIKASTESDQSACFFLTFDGQQIADASPQYGQGVLKAAISQLSDDSLVKLTQAMGDLVRHLPFLKERAAFQPMAELFRSGGTGPRGQL
jgi:DNA-binding MarR family transcriptional regulator